MGPIGGVQLGNNNIIENRDRRPMLNNDGTIIAAKTGSGASAKLNFGDI